MARGRARSPPVFVLGFLVFLVMSRCLPATPGEGDTQFAGWVVVPKGGWMPAHAGVGGDVGEGCRQRQAERERREGMWRAEVGNRTLHSSDRRAARTCPDSCPLSQAGSRACAARATASASSYSSCKTWAVAEVAGEASHRARRPRQRSWQRFRFVHQPLR